MDASIFHQKHSAQLALSIDEEYEMRNHQCQHLSLQYDGVGHEILIEKAAQKN